MPLYEYTCASCATRFEALVRSFREEIVCPRCASKEVEKQLSTFAMSGVSSADSGGGCGCGRGGCGCHH
jgi:putative FmdB family regulatory protein